ncbi:DNA repair protein RAD4 [Andrographis paniculata]|uniref:DNA repair protein RAD4 n=1 Tax=Andrographis paniculata TaxID=175694 RepID=UPI0021E940D7|nr:DNA repair protein RAD4 [Andrographis paniculata]
MERGSKVVNKKYFVDTSRENDSSPPNNASDAEATSRDDNDYEFDDSEWEVGFIPTLSSTKDFINGVSVEFDISHGSAKKKQSRRATAEEKEVAELLHKAHLLCLLGRGRLIDGACNDPLIQASLVSLVPSHLLKITETSKLTASDLFPLVSWFHQNFHVGSPSIEEKPCHLALASALETQQGTPEEITALSVALFRALNLTVRFVSILDVVSLKPGGDKSEYLMEVVSKKGKGIFSSSTLMVSEASCSSANLANSLPNVENESSQTTEGGASHSKAEKLNKLSFQSQDALAAEKMKDVTSDVLVSETPIDNSESGPVKSEGLKRKGDLEFEMQMEMALAATAIESSKTTMASNVSESPSTSSVLFPPSKKMKIIKKEESQNLNGISTAIGSKKVGAPLYWAEVFCNGENLTGRWVHVDSVNAIIDGEHKLEAAAAACRKSLRYVVAFAGQGAKDVTRRYCTKWHKVAAQRVNSTWWDAVLAPLRELELAATSGYVDSECKPLGQENHEVSLDKNSNRISEECPDEKAAVPSLRNSVASTRSVLEDVELETRALTEPLPTNQQAYRNHHLYVIERWLKKYEVLYPKGPVLGFCSGHPVYPRTCVQLLHTKERWLREGKQVKAGEVPVKILKRSLKRRKEDAEDDSEHVDEQGTTVLYGKWQTEPLCLPQAVNGIVPKNERGQVDVWSEKCLPPGTAHLPFPRIALVAKRLEVDYAPAMVGFESRNDRSVPIYNGIVVCTEFKDAILEAYLEEEEKRAAEDKRRNEVQALSRWYQLLSSIITRQRLNHSYGDGALSESSMEAPKTDKNSSMSVAMPPPSRKASAGSQKTKTPDKHSAPPPIPAEDHQHEFILEEMVSEEVEEEEGRTLIKRCHCGFSIQFEEL